MGYLVYTSGQFPKPLAVMLIVGCFCYLGDLLAKFLAPSLGADISAYLMIAPAVAEVWMVFYLLIRGIRPAKPVVA